MSRLRRRARTEPREVPGLPARDGDAGRPIQVPEAERRYLYVSEDEIRELSEGRVPAIVQRQARVALMSTEEWVQEIRRKALEQL